MEGRAGVASVATWQRTNCAFGGTRSVASAMARAHGHDGAWPSRSTTKPVSWRDALGARPSLRGSVRIALLEGRAPSRPLALGTRCWRDALGSRPLCFWSMAVRSPAPNTATKWRDALGSRPLWLGRTATTKRGPPGRVRPRRSVALQITPHHAHAQRRLQHVRRYRLRPSSFPTAARISACTSSTGRSASIRTILSGCRWASFKNPSLTRR